MTPTPDNAAAVEFMQVVHPDGPWALTSIEPDTRAIETRTFYPGQESGMEDWIAASNGKQNLYWHVNAVKHAVTKKATREDISEVRWLHVDIDPRAGEDLEAERKRALKLLCAPPEGVPVPTIVVFSGGGYQGFWKLNTPIEINGDIPLAEEAKRYNQQLERVFGADNCHNIDRIMRLPGTINMPDERKIAKGRTPTLAMVVDQSDFGYDISQFTPARLVQNTDIGFGGNSVQVSGNVPRLNSVDELDDSIDGKVEDWCKAVIVLGKDPNDENKYASRSEAVFAVVCHLVRKQVPDEMIYSVLMDPDFAISSRILSKGSSAQTYALRQIQRAKDHTINPWLEKMNGKHAVISDLGGKCLVISDSYDEVLRQNSISYQGFGHFINRYMNQQVECGENAKGQTMYKPLGRWWLEHPQRQQYETLVFAPGREVPDAYNLWRGFGVESVPGDCSLYLNHLYKNICSGVDEHFDYLVKWMARAVQKPDCPGEVAVILRGKQGTGKGVCINGFGRLFGRHFQQVSDSQHLVGHFNAHLRECSLLFADEAFYAGDKQHESALKRLVTEKTLKIEGKGIDVEDAPNYIHLMMASNSHWVVPAGAEERRFLVLDVADTNMQQGAYFDPLSRQLEKEGGYEALLHFLLNKDLTDFDVRKFPQTKALQEQKELSYSVEQEWWFRKLKDGRLHDNHVDWHTDIPREALQDDYIEYTQKHNFTRRSNSTALGRFITRACPEDYPHVKQVKEVERRPYHYVLPSLEECRAHWDKFFGGPFAWPCVEIEDGQDQSARSVPF